MKTDFSIPRRQNFRGILVVFLMDLVKSIKRNIYVFLPLLSSKIRENYLEVVIIGLILLVILQLLYSYKSYLNFKFHVQDQRFFLRHGVFNFTDTDIPFDRIQNININQNLIQQALNVVGFEIETAGQNTAEIKIKALSREDALALKEILLKNRAEDNVENSVSNSLEDRTEGQIENASSEPVIPHRKRVLFNLSLGELLKVGVSSNYIKGLGLVLFFVSTIFQYLQEFFDNFYEINFENTYLTQAYETFAFVVGFIIFLLAATFIVTIGRTVFKYYDLKVTKVDKDYEVEYGLLKRINQVIKKSKAQVFEVEENPIKNLFKIKNVFISQASSQELQDKKKIGVVGISDENINILFKSLFDLSYPQQFINIQSSMRMMFRLMIKYFVLCILIGLGLFTMLGLTYSLILPILLLGVFTFISFKTIQKSHIGVNDDLIEVHSGSIHTNKKYIATHKVQSIAIKRNWFQQRNNHADLIIYTASGLERIGYLKYDEVVKVVNYLNFKVESSALGWI
ncbi:hypothetical protein ERX46_15510 [Brumimicrobium glaciale]|uniref:YdbS-like PH domain-containing protein n=1 Tax=Brumimicrobium glaciale TaxID=200475 RepID=A0A4Q4KGZ4_9FLAO|nr:PH domain-containing protein [Brumimicrobium glaciale]RYM32088.1 hypothetical protein ERX46_15510 [Brumimicrobium glaciale]